MDYKKYKKMNEAQKIFSLRQHLNNCFTSRCNKLARIHSQKIASLGKPRRSWKWRWDSSVDVERMRERKVEEFCRSFLEEIKKLREWCSAAELERINNKNWLAG